MSMLDTFSLGRGKKPCQMYSSSSYLSPKLNTRLMKILFLEKWWFNIPPRPPLSVSLVLPYNHYFR